MKLSVPNFVPEGSSVGHGFFGRAGGVSTGLYGSLNCGLGSQDDQQNVRENLRRVAAEFDAAPDNLAMPYQHHSADCLTIESAFTLTPDRPKGDALVTDCAGVMLGILTADCAPVLFCGEKADGGTVIGAAHAGWGGALRGVLESTVRAMTEKGARLASIRAAVGPCIGPKSYEVSEGFEKPFVDRNPEDDRFFRAGVKPGKLMFDLPGYVAARLQACGVRHVVLSDIDTVTREDAYFSHRRATLRAEKDTGRQIAVIVFGRKTP